MFVNSSCGQLILRKIGKIGASRYQILRLKSTKFTRGAYSAPRLLPLFKGPTSKGWRETGEGEEKVKGKEGIWHTQKFWCGAPYGMDLGN